MEEFKPGQVISPQGATPEPPQPPVPADGSPEPERPAEPDPAPAPAPAPEPAATPDTAEAQTEPEAQTAPETEAAGWQYHQSADAAPAPAANLPESLSWTASEFIAHEKGASWYGLLAVVGLAAAALDYLLLKDLFSTGVIIFAAIAFGIFAAHKPRAQQYNLDRRGVRVGDKVYGFQDFKTFSVAEEGAVASIVFMPLKRFMPPLTVYVAPEIEDQVVDFLSAFLPFEQHKADAVDSLLRRIRF